MNSLKREIIVLLISASTDFMVVAGTAFNAATLLDRKVVALCVVGGLLAFARTIQQGLRTNPAFKRGMGKWKTS